MNTRSWSLKEVVYFYGNNNEIEVKGVKIMKKQIAILLGGIMVVTLVACSGGESGGEVKKDTPKAEAVVATYTVDAEEANGELYPENYPKIAAGEFKESFKVLEEKNMDASLEGYQDIVDIFGVDGAYYEKCDLDHNSQLYKYYGWYGDDGSNILITFLADGDNLEYYAYVANGLN